MDEQNKNLILATALSMLVILVWMAFFSPPPPQPDLASAPDANQPVAGQDGLAAAPPTTNADGTVAATTPGGDILGSREEALALTNRVAIETSRVRGSLSLTGGRIDDLALLDYREELPETSNPVTLLSPAQGPTPYYALYGWAPTSSFSGKTPGASTEWSVETGTTLTPTTPVTLRWDNETGQIFRRTIAIDDNFLFTITQSVENLSDTPIRLAPYGIIARRGLPSDLRGFFILHEGVVRSIDGELGEIDYDDMPDFDVDPAERAPLDKVEVTDSGWIGFTDQYWMTNLIPVPGQTFTAAAKYTAASDTYQTDMRLPVMEVAPGATADITTNLFAGAKEWETIRDYQENLNINQFVDSIDWGWFAFFTKPIFWALHYLNVLIGNMGVAIISLTLVIKILLLPLAYKSYVSMAKMKNLQPEMEKIKEKAGDDRQKLQQEMMALYKKEKVNPASGCLPILVQIPIFFSLYKVIFVTIELRHAPFFGWIQDLSAPDPTSWMNLFGLLPYEIPGFLALVSIGVWPILMGITMWLQQKLNPAPTDPTQAMIFAWMPWVFMFMLGSFASGLVIYWVANNTITFLQQYAIMRSQGMTPDVFGNITSSFKKKKEKAE